MDDTARTDSSKIHIEGGEASSLAPLAAEAATAAPAAAPAEAPAPDDAPKAPSPLTATVTDARGRQIGIKKMNALARLDMASVLGDKQGNQIVQGMAAMAFSVTAIDGEPVHRPQSWRELRFLIDRLDDVGVERIEQAYIDLGWIDMEQLASLTAQLEIKN